MTYLPVIRGVIDRRILVNFRVDFDHGTVSVHHCALGSRGRG